MTGTEIAWLIFIVVPFVYWSVRAVVQPWYQSWRGR